MADYLIVPKDCIDALKKLPANSIDSMVTDPPAGISFMGKEWDKSDGFIPFMTEVMKEALRVLKPGAHAFVWAIPRTSHWTATALEEAGFEIRDVVTHLFGSGFPKSLDISKAIDKAAGAEREVVGRYEFPDGGNRVLPRTHSERVGQLHGDKHTPVTAPATPEAKQWQGWGTALKPASEHWILVRKPLGEKTVAANVLKYGTGGLNIDASRIGSELVENGRAGRTSNAGGIMEAGMKPIGFEPKVGRFPANLVLSHNDDCETECTPGCAVAELDRQSLAGGMHGAGHAKPRGNNFNGDKSIFGIGLKDSARIGDSGGASRFFYCAKASKRERNVGCEGLNLKPNNTYNFSEDGSFTKNFTADSGIANREARQNHHPTVKPTKLMQYLITMVTPPDGTVLDPFMGSGSTGVAAISQGFHFIGIERESEYFMISLARLRNAFNQLKGDEPWQVINKISNKDQMQDA